MEDDSSGFEGDVDLFLGVVLPVEDSLNVRAEHVVLIAVSDGGLKEDSDGVGEGV